MDERVDAIVYDGSSVTSPKNWNNPKFGDPCYSLHTDSRNYVVIVPKESDNECYAIDCKHFFDVTKTASTLLATDYKEPQAVCYEAAAFIGRAGAESNLAYTIQASPTLRATTDVDVVYCIQGGGETSRNSHGLGWKEEVSYTLNIIDKHAVCYGIDQQGGKSNCGYAEDVMPTLCSDSHGTPHAVCYGIIIGDRAIRLGR